MYHLCQMWARRNKLPAQPVMPLTDHPKDEVIEMGRVTTNVDGGAFDDILVSSSTSV
jgi:hypothetical protein